jgi:hypothetical protein
VQGSSIIHKYYLVGEETGFFEVLWRAGFGLATAMCIIELSGRVWIDFEVGMGLLTDGGL